MPNNVEFEMVMHYLEQGAKRLREMLKNQPELVLILDEDTLNAMTALAEQMGKSRAVLAMQSALATIPAAGSV